MIKIGIIGSGNMGQALIKGWINKGYKLSVFSPNNGKKVAEKYKIESLDLTTLVKESDVIVLSFLPDQLDEISSKIAQNVDESKTVISVLGDVKLKHLEDAFKSTNNVIRTLPNTNIGVNEGEIAYLPSHKIEKEKLEESREILGELGELFLLPENQFSIFSSIAGSGPAIVAKFAESLVLAGVKNGLSRDAVINIVNQLIIGTVMNSKENHTSFNDLIYQICTPGGSTIKGVESLEKSGFSGEIMEAVNKIIE